MKNDGYSEVILKCVEDISNVLKSKSQGKILLEENHKLSLQFLLMRYSPDLLIEALNGIPLTGSDEFIFMARKRCARKYSEDFEGGTNG